MTAMSDYLENKIVDHLFRTSTFAKPTNIYVGLFTAAPSDSGGGTEVSGGSYTRASVDGYTAPNDAAWNATQGGNSGDSSGTSGATSNSVDITFPSPTADWGTVVAFGIFDSSAGGNLLIHGALASNKVVNSGDAAPKFLVGALDITFD